MSDETKTEATEAPTQAQLAQAQAHVALMGQLLAALVDVLGAGEVKVTEAEVGAAIAKGDLAVKQEKDVITLTLGDPTKRVVLAKPGDMATVHQLRPPKVLL